MQNKYFSENSKRFRIEITTTKETPFTASDISKFIDKFSSLYYKTDLLRSFVSYINTGINLNEFAIFNRTLNNYYNIDNKFSLIKNVDFVINHGYFQSLITEKHYYELSILFDSFNEINRQLKSNNISKIQTEQFKQIIEFYYKNGFNETIKSLYTLPEKISYDKLKQNIFLKTFLSNHMNKTYEKYQIFETEFNDLIEVFNMLDNEKIKLNNRQEKIVKKYIDPFFERFIDNEFPILIHKSNQNEFQILCHYHFGKNYHDHNLFFDVKEISHNSPTLVVIISAIKLISPFIGVYLINLKIQKDRIENEIKKIELRKKKEDEKIHKSILNQKKILERIINEYSIYDNSFKKNIESEINQIKSPYYRKKIKKILESILDEYKYLYENWALYIKNISLEN